MRLWLSQTGKQERRKETMPFEKCFGWRKYTRSPKYILHSDLDTPSFSNGGKLRGLCQYWFNKVLSASSIHSTNSYWTLFLSPQAAHAMMNEALFLPLRHSQWSKGRPGNTGLSLRSENCSPRAEGRGHLWWEWSWLDNTSWIIILALKNSALGDWLAKNSHQKHLRQEEEFWGSGARKLEREKKPSSTCKRGPGEALWEVWPEKVSNSKDGWYSIFFPLTCFFYFKLFTVYWSTAS